MKIRAAVALIGLLGAPATCQAPQAVPAWAQGLAKESQTLGKPAWRPMLAYDVQMHVASTHAAEPPFEFPWEDTGRGYGYGPGFGHWDLAHEIIDVLPTAPEHAREQLLNDVRLQLPSGFLPGTYWMRKPSPTDDPAIYKNAEKFSDTEGHPPVWVVAADDYMQQTGDRSLAPEFLAHVTRQISWFERERRAKPDGFLYLDIVTHEWESGVDEGVRFDGLGPGSQQPAETACVDATAHVYQMYVYAAKWAKMTGADPRPFAAKAEHLRHFMQTQMWSERDGFFYDAWVLARAPDGLRDTWHRTPAPGRAHSFEGMWPMVVGAATPHQAQRVIHEWLMRKDRFFTPHPIATVVPADPAFELRMWRGPVWNSMTYWAARGAVRYGDKADAHLLLGAALDDTAAQFDRTGIIWEFYHPLGGHPEDLKRKPQTQRNLPWPDYIGHNPLLAMARLWDATQ
jgi:putative isomerase